MINSQFNVDGMTYTMVVEVVEGFYLFSQFYHAPSEAFIYRHLSVNRVLRTWK